MKKARYVIGAVLFFGLIVSQSFADPITPAVPHVATPLPLSAVRLTGGPLKAAQDKDGEYLLSLEPDQMLFFLRKSAGLQPKGQGGLGGWDKDGRQLTGHIAGHYLSAVSYMFAATGDERFKQRVDYIVNELKEVQDAQGDGYIGAQQDNRGTPGKTLFQQVSQGSIRSGGFDLNGMWSPWYVEHKIFAGLRDAYRQTGNKTALDVETKFAGWVESIVSKLDDAQDQKMLATEFGGMNEVLADLYADTGDKRWLAVSDKFEHRAIVQPLANHQDILSGKHGNATIPKMLGDLKRYEYTGNETDGSAAKFFWDEVVDHHTFATGGHGKNEYFGQPDKLNSMIDGRTAESCNVYNMLKFTRELFALKPDNHYADFLERALFNHVLASMDPQTGQMCYMVPVGQGVQHEYQRMESDFTCCVGSGMESNALHSDGIYYESGDTLWINLFAPSTADWKSAGIKVEMETTFPIGDSATLKVASVGSPKERTLSIRRPTWAGNGFSVSFNGAAISNLPKAGSYVEIKKEWKAGDAITLALPKALHVEPLADNPTRMALMWGPLVLAGDLGPEQRGGGGGGRGGRGARGGTTQPAFPVIISSQSIDQWLTPVADKPGTFRTSNVGLAQAIEFVPFYQLHHRRYGIYWDVFAPEQWQKRSNQFTADKELLQKLDAATVAYAQPGEMQPERDFNFQGEGAATIRIRERNGRRSTQWFSLDLPVDPAHPAKLIVTYNNDEPQSRAFRILIDGGILTQQIVARKSPEIDPKFYDVEYDIPQQTLAGKQKITVRFEAINGSEVPGIFGVRTIRADAP